MQTKENDKKVDNTKMTPKEVIIVKGFKPFGHDAPIPTDRNEIKRQLGFKK